MSSAIVTASVVISDGSEETVRATWSGEISAVVGVNGKRETVTLPAATFTALSPPSGAQGVMIDCRENVSLTIKGVTGDTGIVLQPATANPVPVMLPLGSSPSIGLLSTGNATVDVIWF